jgi:hypothetical protein
MPLFASPCIGNLGSVKSLAMAMPLPMPYVLVSVPLYAAPFERTRVIFLTNFILFGCCFCTVIYILGLLLGS